MLSLTARVVLCLFAIAVAAQGEAYAQSSPFMVKVVLAQRAPVIDGTLNDPAWKSAARVNIGWDFTLQRPADEDTTAYLLADAHYLYVAFDAKQKERIAAREQTNDQPLTDDDTVCVYLWPAGKDGIEYSFAGNPIGTRYAASTENTAFSPQWRSVATITSSGYIVTERIPLNVMRGDGRDVWLMQLDRSVRATNETFEWAHSGGQTSADISLYAGGLHGMQHVARAAHARPRIALYGLGEVAPADLGGTTSRAGIDAALPITPTSSFIATVHPDYSNVELDQQSIAPTVFPRRVSEVRPFFTQGANYYNLIDCNDCVGFPMLYTPTIPTPRTGYAVEGTEGKTTFAAFDAIGDRRTDMAQSFAWKSADRRYGMLYQGVEVNLPGMHDEAHYYEAIAGNYHNFNAYATLGNERGTQITSPAGGRYDEYGVTFYTAKSGLFAAYHEVGDQYAPYDSLISVNGVRGPTLYAYREWDNGPRDFIQSIKPTIDLESLRDDDGKQRFADGTLDLSIASRNQWALDITAGSTYIRPHDTIGGLLNQNGVSLTYLQNTPTASSLTYRAGHFGNGFLRTTDLKSAVSLGRIATLSFEAYGTDQTFPDAPRLQEWLERTSVAVQIAPGESLALGWRKIVGTGPTFSAPTSSMNATNLSCAYYRRLKDAEIYITYGTPSELNTRHDVLLKVIRYIGAGKGT